MKSSFLLRICQIACILSFLFLLTHSVLVLDYAKAGLSSWAFCVLPVLLPFIILSKFWIYCGIPQLFYHAVRRALPHHAGAALFVTILLLGLSSGFPIGAVFVRHFYEEAVLPKEAAEKLLPLCSFVSPMFLIGYVRPLTGYVGTDWYLFVLSLYLPLLLHLGGLLLTEAPGITGNPHPEKEMTKTARPSSTRDIWLSSLEIIFTIGIYMMLFSILYGIILHELRSTVMEIILSNLEITTGIRWLSRMPALTGSLRGCVMSAVVSAGGLCTMAQVYSATFPCAFSMRRYLAVKGKCALLSGALYLLIQ